LISLHDVDVAGAAAQVSGDRVTNFIVARVAVLFQKRNSRHQHSGRAIAALQTVFLVEAVLKRMEFAVLFETFDSRDRSSIGLNREDGA